MIYVNDIILMSAGSFLKKQKRDGSFTAGNNGPYFDKELPNRNTAHIIILLLKAYSISKKQEFLNSADKALKFILRNEFRPMKATFLVRNNPYKDFCNGLIGQAWMCEALIYSYKYFKEKIALKIAGEVILKHPFDKEIGLWRIVNVDGSSTQIDYAFNHQLWFAAIASNLENDLIQKRVKKFLDKIFDNLRIHNDGLIMHSIKLNGSVPNIKSFIINGG